MALALDLLEADFWDVPFVAAAQQEEERIHYMRRFNLHTFTERQCLDFFRFKSEQLVHLCRCLRMPHKMTAANATNASGLEVLCLVLRRLVYTCRYVDLEDMIQRPSIEIGLLFNTGVDYIDSNFRGRLTESAQPDSVKADGVLSSCS